MEKTLNFKDYYSKESFSQLLEINFQERSKENVDYNKIFDAEEVFYQSVSKFIQDKAKNGEILPIKNSQTHTARFINLWDNLIENKLDSYQIEDLGTIFRGIVQSYVSPLFYNKKELPFVLQNMETHYNTLTEVIQKGNFDWYDLKVEGECVCCGSKFHPLGKNWKIVLAEVDYKNKDSKITPLKPCMEDKLYQVKVEFKTGELLIADWFRIDEFTKQVGYNQDYQDVSINYASGRLKSTQHAANLGFVTVHVGNSSPTILRQDDSFVFGYVDDERDIKTEHVSYGSVCTDLWNVTVIDKSRLIEIVALKTGMEKAQQIVETYIEKERHNMTISHVEPGEYTITFNPIQESYSNNPDDPIPEGVVNAYLQMRKSPVSKQIKMKR